MTLLTKKIKTLGAIVFAVICFTTTSINAAPLPSIVTSGGQMIGINNVDIEGFGLYNITFNNRWREGDFQSRNFILAAGQALMDDWTGNGIFQGNDYDTGIKETVGCDDFALNCHWFTAEFDISSHTLLYGGSFDNVYGPNEIDSLVYWGIGNQDHFNLTFLQYEEVGNVLPEVPIPAAAFMFAPALLGFLGLRRRAKNTAT